MSPLMSSHGAALATAMAAVSGTVILIAICRQKPLSAQFTATTDRGSTTARRNLRPCISSGERKRERGANEKKKKKEKMVHFAEEVGEEFDREGSSAAATAAEEEGSDLAPNFGRGPGAEEARRVPRQLPANRVALYNGILQDRLQRMARSY